MFILKKKHEEVLKKANNNSYKEGYLDGHRVACMASEGKIKVISQDNAKMAIQIRKMDDMVCANLVDVESKKKAIKRLEDKVAYLEQSRSEAYELINQMRCEIDVKNKEVDMVVADREKRVDILKFFLRCTYDKDVSRYEAIARRTKNSRIREKAEKRIIQIKEQKLAFNK